ncbi:putative amp dependent CoA ligase [Lentithecium fluviatile CBS 122367]|uniref:Putative amp dependent CoA ligase n=1 Tax=Lentithecium fluviatile CBS 122367 TaxID=1168545 RepID=A0A6G1JLV5_9PLEO|nr:putative amp dependent CoA ligase [Lentithecium fluviatile CBS 122367]
MVSYLLLGIPCLILAIRYLFSLLHRTENPQDGQLPPQEGEQLAEVEGATWPQLSVFEHIERGLKRNPHGPAVICLMDQTASLQQLVATCSEEGEENEENRVSRFHNDTTTPKLWCKDRGQVHSLHEPEKTPPRSPTREEKAIAFTLTYTQLHRMALKLAAGLLAVGVQPNTRMIMLIPNGAEYPILLWACILLRITYVSLDPACLDISGFTALKHTLQTIKPQLVVAPDVVSGKAIEVAMSELELPQPVRICLSESASASPGWKSLAAVANHANTQGFVDETALISAARQDNPRRINSIMFTSGTSGIPKGCPQSVSAISHALHSQEWLIDPESGTARYALMQPHNSRGIAPAQTLQTWRAGGAVVLTGQGFSVRDAIKAIEQLGATFLVLTPPMVHEFSVELAARPIDVSCVKRIQVGGDAVTKEVLAKCAALFAQAQVCVNQGMTEGPGVFAWPFLETPPTSIPFVGGQICPVGVVASGARVRLCSTLRSGAVAKRGELGELHISCPSIIRHYLGGRSEESFYNDKKWRWFNTGDMAMIDGNGLVFIVGRRKDMIQRAGVTIAPAVIESCVAAFTQSQTVVVAAPHPVIGAEPFAVVDSFANASAEQIKEHIRAVLGRDYALGGVACLKQLGLVEFPVNATHKIIKSEVQEAVLKHLKRISAEKARVQIEMLTNGH